MTPETLDELRRLAEEATPGPWGRGYWSGQCHKHQPGTHPGPPRCVFDYELRHDEPGEDSIFDNPHHIISLSEPKTVAGNYDSEEGGIVNPADAALIVAAVNALPALLDAARLGLAWAAVEERLPEGWRLAQVSGYGGRWTACAAGPRPEDLGTCDCCGQARHARRQEFKFGHGPTPTAALEALREALRAAMGDPQVSNK